MTGTADAELGRLVAHARFTAEQAAAAIGAVLENAPDRHLSAEERDHVEALAGDIDSLTNGLLDLWLLVQPARPA